MEPSPGELSLLDDCWRRRLEEELQTNLDVPLKEVGMLCMELFENVEHDGLRRVERRGVEIGEPGGNLLDGFRERGQLGERKGVSVVVQQELGM